MAVVLLVVAGLALAGVFSSGSKPHTIGTTTSPATTTSPGRTTTTTTAKSPATSGVAAPTATSKAGDSGAQVKQLQRALAQLGYAPGKIDGDYGPLTQAALVRFQKASKLVADGIFGPLTLKALKTALRSNG